MPLPIGKTQTVVHLDDNGFPRPVSFSAACRTGFWFCQTCERLTEPQGEIHKICGHKHCGSSRLQYVPPVQTTEYEVVV